MNDVEAIKAQIKADMDKDEEWRDVLPSQWKCNWLKCDWGMGLAGRDVCPGDPRQKECEEFSVEFSSYTEGEGDSR